MFWDICGLVLLMAPIQIHETLEDTEKWQDRNFCPHVCAWWSERVKDFVCELLKIKWKKIVSNNPIKAWWLPCICDQGLDWRNADRAADYSRIYRQGWKAYFNNFHKHRSYLRSMWHRAKSI